MSFKLLSIFLVVILGFNIQLEQKKVVLNEGWEQDWIQKEHYSFLKQMYLKSPDVTLKSLIDKYTPSCREDKLSDIQTRFTAKTNRFKILTYNCMDSEVTTNVININSNNKYEAISKLNNDSLLIEVNRNELSINGKEYMNRGKWRHTIFNSFLAGHYVVLDSMNNFITDVEIDSNGDIMDNNYFKRINLYDYVSGWDWDMWLKPTIENSDYVNVISTLEKRSYTYELVRTNEGYELRNRRTSVYYDSPKEDPNYSYKEGLFYTFKKNYR